jgi:hypothetical protein
MTFGSVDITINTVNATSCYIRKLDSRGNDFQSGDINIFEGKDIDDCYNFEVPDYQVRGLTVQHSGIDGWKPEWFRIFFTSGAFVQCQDGDWIDNNEMHNIEDCQLVYSSLPGALL